MTAWVKNGTREEVGIITDWVDPEYVISAFSRGGDCFSWLMQGYGVEQAACRRIP